MGYLTAIGMGRGIIVISSRHELLAWMFITFILKWNVHHKFQHSERLRSKNRLIRSSTNQSIHPSVVESLYMVALSTTPL